VRPIPHNVRLITKEDALRATFPYRCIIAHSETDLLDLKEVAVHASSCCT
jgi:hypothetical protein